MEGADQPTDLLAQNPLQRNAPREDRGRADPELRQGRDHLAADESHPDDHRVPVGLDLALDRLALRNRPELVDSGQLDPWDVEPPVPSPGGDQDLLVLELLARFQDDPVGGGVDRGDRLGEPLDFVLLVPLGRSHEPAIELLLGPEIGLGQRGSAEGHSRFAADQDDPALKPLVAKRGHRVAAGEAGADDHDRLAVV